MISYIINNALGSLATQSISGTISVSNLGITDITGITNSSNYLVIDNSGFVHYQKVSPCLGINTGNTPSVYSLYKKTDDFDTLELYYFVKNDIITGVTYNDNTSVIGASHSYTEYYDNLVSSIGTLNTPGGNINLPCFVCGDKIISASSSQLITYVNSDTGCRKLHTSQILINKISFSERYSTPYRFNPGIDDYPVIVSNEVIDDIQYKIQKVVFADSYTSGPNEGECYIRYLKFKTNLNGTTTFDETGTLIGAKKPQGGTNSTFNNSPGDSVVLDRATSVCVDNSEISNGYPVLYFSTYGGVVCRAVRNNSGNCDERANWNVYVILDSQPTDSFYGIKKWYLDENNNQTFLAYDSTQGRVKLLTYNNTGSKNDASNWTVTNITTLNGSDGNINTEISENRFWLYGNYELKICSYSASNTLTDLQNVTNYSVTDICVNPSASPTSYIDGTGDVATIWKPYWLQKINVSGEDRYYFGNCSNDNSNNYQDWSYLRYVRYIGLTPSIPESWQFYTDIVVNVNGDGPWSAGTWVYNSTSNVNALSLGMCKVDDLGWISLAFNGVKLFDFVSGSVSLITGQTSSFSDLDAVNQQMDTQWEYICN